MVSQVNHSSSISAVGGVLVSEWDWCPHRILMNLYSFIFLMVVLVYETNNDWMIVMLITYYTYNCL